MHSVEFEVVFQTESCSSLLSDKKMTGNFQIDIPVTVEGRTSQKRHRCQTLVRCEQSVSNAPLCYKQNSEKERICEAIVDEYVQNNPHLRQRLFVMSENEFGVSKCVCSTLKPTLLPYPDIYDSSDCSRFVAHFLHYEPLEIPDQSPQILPSPSQVLQWGIGDCFDLATVLTSFLIGAGYDAFVVYGKAPEWVCNRDRSKTSDDNNLLTDNPEAEQISRIVANLKKSGVEESRSMNSLSQNRTFGSDDHQKDTVSKEQVHCWVFVRTNSRCPPGSADYFIEPSTGHHYPLSKCPYRALFAVWNSNNYWINTKEGDEIDYAEVLLESQHGWESVFLDRTSNQRIDDRGSTNGRMPFDPPLSWVEPLSISETMFSFKYPTEGRRTVQYNKERVELFSEGAQTQGVKKRITSFQDEMLLFPIQIVEYFGRNRNDSLQIRVRLPQFHCFQEIYLPQNKQSLKEWVEFTGERRRISFHSRGRSDGLDLSQEVFGKEIMYMYSNRRDRLARIQVEMIWVEEEKAKMKGRLVFPSGDGNHNAIVTLITETYTLPMEVCAGVQVVASRILNLKEKSLETEYYDSGGGVERMKVVQRKGRNNTSTMNDDDGLIDHQNMINAEKEMVTRVKNLQIENLDFVRTRRRDEDGLRKAFFTGDHDVEVGTSRPKTPALIARKNDQEQTSLDYLSPYLFFVKDVHNITTEEAMMVYKSCTRTLEDRMLERANIIQNRLNEENERLAQCQASYQQRLLQIDGQSEQDFEQLCSEINFKIKILEKRLHDHEESSLDKLKKLELKLKGDERLNSPKAQTSDAPLK